ncbi:transposase [bacterium]|nr:transposase [bacterium]
MPGAVSVDLRKRVVGAYRRKEGSIRGLARRFDVSAKSVERWLKLDAETGSVEPSRGRRGPRPKIDGEGMELLEGILRTQPDITNGELVEELEARGGIQTSTSGVSRAVARLGWTRKKNAAGS